MGLSESDPFDAPLRDRQRQERGALVVEYKLDWTFLSPNVRQGTDL
jgi:putative NADH-flavin reductase